MLKISREEFVENIIIKLTKSYGHELDIIINVIALTSSIFFIIDSNTTLKDVTTSFFLYCGIRFMIMSYFGGLSISSVEFLIHYKNLFMHFIVTLHFCLLFLASIINTLKLEFTREGKIITLDFFDAYYYVLSIVSTIGSNIYPVSKDATLFTMFLSFITLLLVVFLFTNLSGKVTIRKEYFKSAEKTLSYYFTRFLDLFNEQKLSYEEQNKLFKYLMEEFDFNTPNGYRKIYDEMERGLYPIEGIKSKAKEYVVTINEKKHKGVDAIAAPTNTKNFELAFNAKKGEGVSLLTNATIFGYKGGIYMQTNFKNQFSLAASLKTPGEVDTILQPNI